MTIHRTNNLLRATMTLLVMLTLSLTASATDFITDVMVAGHSDHSQFDTLIQNLQQEGWTDISKDLNQGCGSSSDYIHLLYKTLSSTDNSGSPITDFYISTSDNPSDTITHDGRTYYLVPCDGSDGFVNSMGDLNHGAGGDYIYLYYTKDALSNHHAVTSITFNTTQSGAVGANGGTTGYDLNSGCGSGTPYIYMHTTTALPSAQPQYHLDACTGNTAYIYLSGWTYDPDAPSVSLDVHVYIYTDANYTNLYMPIQLVHANVPRPDVNTYYNITGNHGFQATFLIADVGNYWVKVYAIDHDGGTNPLIGSKKVNVTAGNIVTLTSESRNVQLQHGDILTGTGGANTHVTIADGALVRLNGVNITAINTSDGLHRWSGISCLGDAVIVLDGGTTNDVTGGFFCSGISVPAGKTLTIQGSGTLNTNGHSQSAGIGSNEYSSCGNITISGGTINAHGGQYAAGIGSGYQGSRGNIIISGGTVTAHGGDNGVGIGSGNKGSCDNIVISGGSVTAYGSQNSAGIGTGDDSSCNSITISGGTVMVVGGGWGAGIGCGHKGSCGDITISGGTINATGNLYGAGIGCGAKSSCGDITISGGTITSEAGYYAAGIGSGYNQSSCGDITITDGVTRLTAMKNEFCDNTIGAGSGSTCGTVTIGAVETGFIEESPFITYPYTISFNANGGTGTMTDMSCMYNVEQNLTANSFARTNYILRGWATSPNGPKVYDDEQSIINLTETAGATVTLYAVWVSVVVVTLTSESGNVQLQYGNKLTGTGGPNTHVTIADGAKVIFSGVNITTITNDANHRWPGVTCLGDAIIVLDEGTTNNVKGGNYSPGIYVPEGKTLTIRNSGTLNATGNNAAAGIGSGYNSSSCGNITIISGTVNAIGGQYGAGIGSGNNNSSCGNITIIGGTVNATGGQYAAGIGCGNNNSSCGNITITRDVTTVTATKGTGNNYAVGEGNGSSTCGTITIGDLVTGSITQSPFITFPYTVGFDANGGVGTMSNMNFMNGVPQNLTANSFTNSFYAFEGWATSPNGPKIYDNEQSVNNLTETVGATVTLYAKWTTNLVTLTPQTGEVQLQHGDVLTGTGGPNTHVTITDGVMVIFSGVNNTAISSDHSWPGITCLGDAVIILDEGTTNNVKGGNNNPGIYIPQNKTLTIQGNGTLNATGNSGAAGIGSRMNASCGNIIISGGTITAIGGSDAAGIGGGYYNSSCGTITISGSTITATGGNNAAGIGSGRKRANCGNITISDSNVTATGSWGAAGIGTSFSESYCGSITISSGTVTATGGNSAAGIGTGYSGCSCGNITISGGTVTAYGGDDAAGIGTGYSECACGNITISGGTVTAYGGYDTVGIGSSGTDSSCNNITITNGVTCVTVIKGESSLYTMGASSGGEFGTITIGGVVDDYIIQSPFITFPYSVSFNANGGTGTMADMSFMYSYAKNLIPNTFTNSSIEFEGWSTSLNGPKVYDDGQSVTNLTETPCDTVTLYAKWMTCFEPEDLAVTNVTSSTATLSWTEYGDATTWQIMLNNDESNLISVDENPFTLTGLIPETAYTAKVRAYCNNDDQSLWTDSVCFTPTNPFVIGSSDSTYHNLPMNNQFNYSLSQQIYTAAELGEAGLIESIGFYKNGTVECNRDIDIYMVYTDKNAFENSTDLITVAATDRVFHGTVNFSHDDWTVITLDDGFIYDGLHNVVLVVDDNTCNAAGHTLFKAFATEQVQSIYYCSDGLDDNFDPTAPPSAGITTANKNQLRVFKTELSNCMKPQHLTAIELTATTATLSWNEISNATAWQIMLNDDEENLIAANENPFTLTGLILDTVYTAKVRSACGSDWSNPLSFIPTQAFVIGVADDNQNIVPLHNGFNYSLTQQIYTVGELGEAGFIESIGFFKNSIVECNRNIDIYMASTEKSAFESVSDWIAVTEFDRVFSGTVSFTDNGWTDIILDESFIYDGLHNVVLVVDDNTGSHKGNTVFKTFSTEQVQTIRQADMDNNYDPTELTANANYTKANKNVLRVLKTPPTDCMKPVQLAATEVTAHAATLGWTQVGEANAWQIMLNDDESNLIAANENPFTLTGLVPETAYTAKVRSACGSEWSSPVSFTTPEACPAPIDLTCVNVSGTTATLSWTETGEATAWQIMLNDDESNLINANGSPFMLTYLIPETAYTVKVRSNCDAEGYSEWSNAASFTPTDVFYIGPDDDAIEELPLTNDYCYSLTQQIYTVEELGEAGLIMSIGFFKNEAHTCNRNIDIYMIHTEKTTFTNLSDWVPVTVADRVFSGTVNFTYDDWTVITLDHGFLYDGLHNVVIVVDDNTGDDKHSTSFKAFNTDSQYQSICYFDDENNLDPTGTLNNALYRIGLKNQLRITKEIPTFTKDILGYGTGNGRWNLVASPVAHAVMPSENNGFLANEFDLYRFNPTYEENEWENYEAASFPLVNGHGYVYANSGDVTLTFIGMPYNGNGEVALEYDANDERKCWNLVGNPFASAATLDREYYVLNSNGTGINRVAIPANTPILPCTAVFVKAVSTGDKAVFTVVAP